MKAASPLRRRLNPFALPAETDVRFSLLLFAGVMLAVITGYAITRALWSSFSPPNTLEGIDQAAIRGQLVGEILQALALFALPGAVLLAAAFLFLLHPLMVRRGMRAKRLQPGMDPEMEKELDLLSRRAGLRSPPRIELGEGFGTGGQAYGLPERYILRLGGGMRLLMRKARDAFQAIVFHELAHIYNRDVWRAYTAQAVWTAATWTSLIPFLVATGYVLIRRWLGASPGASALQTSVFNIVLLAVQIAVCIMLVSVMRAGLLRAREVYADWRAASWGTRDGLARVLQQSTAGTRPSRWTAWLRLHPPLAERLALLDDPAGLFEIRSDLPFLAGVLTAWGLSGMAFILPTVTAGLQALGYFFPDLALLIMALQALAFILGFFAVAYLLAGSLGAQVQRQAVLNLVDGRTGLAGYVQLLLPALLVAAGMVAGYFVIPYGDVNYQSWPGVRTSFMMLALAWLLSWLGLAYARFTALRILGRRTGAAAPKWSLRFLNLALAGVLGLLYFYLEAWRLCYVFTVENAGDPACDSTAWQGLAVLGIYALFFLGTAVVLAVKRLVVPPRCPQCGAVLKTSTLVGARHSACGGSLSEWLYIPESSPPDPGPREEVAGLPATAPS